ncbi:hypothetical protein [Actinomadura kijaniata]|uniref:hypothetical protein n=1 Tax=Actinomadura kijaniata TaxID=46161 RepID=UPI0012FBFA94|nr:hypothetical protein [Actinomadura kijaniata]
MEAQAGISLPFGEPTTAPPNAEPHSVPDDVPWTLLTGVPDEGIPVTHLADADRVTQVSRGRWRAMPEHVR